MRNKMNDLFREYTITLRDLLREEPTLLSDIFTFDGDDERADKFIKVFTGMYNIYEIGAETVEEFKVFLQSVYDENIDFYIELLNAYETRIEMLDGAKSMRETEVIDLPSKQTTNEYVSSKERVKFTGAVNVIELKRQYMDIIKNIYKDFATDFKTCFCLIY